MRRVSLNTEHVEVGGRVFLLQEHSLGDLERYTQLQARVNAERDELNSGALSDGLPLDVMQRKLDELTSSALDLARFILRRPVDVADKGDLAPGFLADALNWRLIASLVDIQTELNEMGNQTPPQAEMAQPAGAGAGSLT